MAFPGAGAGGPYGGPQMMMGADIAVGLDIFARSLDAKDRGGFGKSDPYLVVKNTAKTPPSLLHKTEVVKKNLNPEWKHFELFLSETGGWDQPLLWEVFDWDSDGSHDFIGKFTATLNEVRSKKKFDLINPDKKGKMFGKSTKVAGVLHVAKIEERQVAAKIPPYAYNIVFRGVKLDKKDLTSSDPFLLIYTRPKGQGKKTLVARTEVVDKNVNPRWEELLVDLTPCGGPDGKLKIMVFDFDGNGLHDYIGEVDATVKDISMEGAKFPIINLSKKGGMTYNNSGTLLVERVEAIPINMQPPQPVGYEIHFSASKVAKMDGVFGKADPFLVFNLKEKKGLKFLAKTEVIKQSLSPVWNPIQIPVAQCEGMDSEILIQCFDKDSKGQEIIGEFTCTLRELNMKQTQYYAQNPKKVGNIGYSYSAIIHVNSITPLAWIQKEGIYGAYSCRLAGKGIPNKDYGGFGKSDPYFVIRLGHADFSNKGKNTGKPLHKSETIQDESNPVWAGFSVITQEYGGPDGKFSIEVFDHNGSKPDDLIGYVNLTIRELSCSKTTPELAIVDPKKQKKASGVIRVLDFTPVAGAPLIDGAHQAGSMAMNANPAVQVNIAGGMPGGPHQGSMYPAPYGGPGAYPPSMYPPQGPPGAYPPSMYPPHGPPGAYPPSMYPPQGAPGAYPQSMHPPQGPPGAYPQSMYPPQGPPGAYPQSMYPPQGPPGAYPQQQQPPGQPKAAEQPQQSAYPPQGAPGAYPPQQSACPPQGAPGAYPPQQSAYPPQGASPQHQPPGQPEQSKEAGQPGQPQQSAYPPQGAPGAYPPQQSAYPPQGAYPPQQSAYPPQGAPGAYPPASLQHGQPEQSQEAGQTRQPQQPAYPPQGAPGAYPPASPQHQPPGQPEQSKEAGQPGQPQQSAYPPQGAPGAYPPQQSAYPPQGAPGAYPPQQSAYPPQGTPGAYPPQQSAYPPQGAGAYPPASPQHQPPGQPQSQETGQPGQPQQSAYPPQGGPGAYPPAYPQGGSTPPQENK